MSMEQLLGTVRAFEGALVVIPGPGSDAPAIAWGDAFCYYAPDGEVPQHVQPYATIVTKDYPDDTASRLDAPERWRVNIHVDRATFLELTGEDPRRLSRARDYAAADVFTPNPVYGRVSPYIRLARDTSLKNPFASLRKSEEPSRLRFRTSRSSSPSLS